MSFNRICSEWTFFEDGPHGYTSKHTDPQTVLIGIRLESNAERSYFYVEVMTAIFN